MKKFMYLLVATAIFVGCAKKEDDPSDPNNGGNNNVVNNGVAITSLVISSVSDAPSTSVVDKVGLVYFDMEENMTKGPEATWNGASAAINLSTPHTALGSLKTGKISSFRYSGLTFSDEAVKGGFAQFRAYKGSTEVGYFKFEKIAPSVECSLQLLYVDRDVVISGTVIDGNLTLSYNLHLKKGWNKYYYLWGDTSYKLTTDEPSGLKWLYY